MHRQQGFISVRKGCMGPSSTRYEYNNGGYCYIRSNFIESSVRIYLGLGYEVHMDQRRYRHRQNDLGQEDMYETCTVYSASGSASVLSAWSSQDDNLRRYVLHPHAQNSTAQPSGSLRLIHDTRPIWNSDATTSN